MNRDHNHKGLFRWAAAVCLVGAILITSVLYGLSGCDAPEPPDPASDGVLRVVVTSFPAEEFARAVLGDLLNKSGGESVVLERLGKTGQDLHAFEPSAADIRKLSGADILICIGSFAETWLDGAIRASGNRSLRVLSMTDVCELHEEEELPGLGEHDHHHDHEHGEGTQVEYDEHVWTSFGNMARIVTAVRNTLTAALPEQAATQTIHQVTRQLHAIDNVKDVDIIRHAKAAIESGQEVSLDYAIANTDRSVGAMLSGEIAKRYGNIGVPENTLHIKFKGAAGQSFGAFLAHGIHFRLEGEANDYLGKGLSGGHISLMPPVRSTFIAEDNTIAGNTLLYGATSGEVYINGRVGERFCVRNSGAIAVVEGVGDHCCEYMTGGRVVVLGNTGRNFAAGMSGGVAYVWNKNGDFDYYCNMEMVELSLIEDSTSRKELHELIRKHYHHTGSHLAGLMLDNWNKYVDEFIQIVRSNTRKYSKRNRCANSNARLRRCRKTTKYLHKNKRTMGNPRAFLTIHRQEAGYRPVHERIDDFSEVEQTLNSGDRRTQASRCMDCGVPFCHWACPLGNKQPEWQDLLYKGRYKEAYHVLEQTDDFPEFTGRVCPALCEKSCVLKLSCDEPVTIRENEAAIVETAFREGYVQPIQPVRNGKKVAVIGSGPAGLTVANQLNRKGYEVTVFEKDELPGACYASASPISS